MNAALYHSSRLTSMTIAGPSCACAGGVNVLASMGSSEGGHSPESQSFVGAMVVCEKTRSEGGGGTFKRGDASRR